MEEEHRKVIRRNFSKLCKLMSFDEVSLGLVDRGIFEFHHIDAFRVIHLFRLFYILNVY